MVMEATYVFRVITPVLNLISSPRFPPSKSHVYDDARSTEGRFNHHHLLYAGVFPDKPEDQGRVPHPDQVIPMAQNQILTLNRL